MASPLRQPPDGWRRFMAWLGQWYSGTDGMATRHDWSPGKAGAVIKPVAGRGRTTGRRTKKPIAAMPVPANIDHSPRDNFFAKYADPAIVKRLPFPHGIGFAEDKELFGKSHAGVHQS